MTLTPLNSGAKDTAVRATSGMGNKSTSGTLKEHIGLDPTDTSQRKAGDMLTFSEGYIRSYQHVVVGAQHYLVFRWDYKPILSGWDHQRHPGL
jgi:hypothetical protein